MTGIVKGPESWFKNEEDIERFIEKEIKEETEIEAEVQETEIDEYEDELPWSTIIRFFAVVGLVLAVCFVVSFAHKFNQCDHYELQFRKKCMRLLK